ncbi:MAG: hypothetical protein TREMPRED_005294, partial [Tremellales sp. Tagirdzhanova-0007]
MFVQLLFSSSSSHSYSGLNRLLIQFVAILSGDTVIVRPKEVPEKGKPVKERVLHIAGITSPRLGSMVREDEPHAFSSREYLRVLLVGKEIAISVTHTVDASSQKNANGQEREFASLLIAPAGPGQAPQDVAMLVVLAGWAKVRDGAGEGDEAVRRLGADEAKRREGLRTAELQAQAEGKGLWAEQPENVIAGVKSPRAGNTRDGESTISEPWGEEAKFFTEVRLLQRLIKVQLLSAPASLGSSPFPSGPTPATAS